MSLLIASKMFTTGRIIFAIFFVIVFVGLMIFSYKKDAGNHKKYYKNAGVYVFITLLLTIIILFASKYFFTH